MIYLYHACGATIFGPLVCIKVCHWHYYVMPYMALFTFRCWIIWRSRYAWCYASLWYVFNNPLQTCWYYKGLSSTSSWTCCLAFMVGTSYDWLNTIVFMIKCKFVDSLEWFMLERRRTLVAQARRWSSFEKIWLATPFQSAQQCWTTRWWLETTHVTTHLQHIGEATTPQHEWDIDAIDAIKLVLLIIRLIINDW